jgi:hypothetical protein
VLAPGSLGTLFYHLSVPKRGLTGLGPYLVKELGIKSLIFTLKNAKLMKLSCTSKENLAAAVSKRL